MHIRPATEADIPQIFEMIVALAEYEKLSHVVIATEDALRRSLFPAAGPAAAEVLLAFDGDLCCGFALFFPNYSTFLAKHGLYLEDLFVKPEARGKGVGRALLTRLAGIAQERGYGRLEWAVLDWNESAIGFYKKLGAIALDDWTVFRVTGDSLARLAAAS